MVTHTPDTIKKIAALAAKAGLVIVGGQAVNTWSLKYYTENTDPWDSLKPFTSDDLDCVGDASKLHAFVELLNKEYDVTVTLPANAEEEKINTAVIEISKGDFYLGVNCLKSILGVETEDITRGAVATDGNMALVLHPLLCLQSKSHNLATLDQSNRQDEKHLRLSIANLHSFLKEQELSVEDAELYVEKITEKASLNTYLQRSYNVNCVDALPLEEWSNSSNERMRALAEIGKEAHKKVQLAAEKEVAAEEWLRQLNPNPFKRNKGIGFLSKFKDLPSKVEESQQPEI